MTLFQHTPISSLAYIQWFNASITEITVQCGEKTSFEAKRPLCDMKCYVR